mgnify:CR=1 FL=1
MVHATQAAQGGRSDLQAHAGFAAAPRARCQPRRSAPPPWHGQILFYTLDALPVLLCLVTYICFHPGYLLPSSPPPPPAAAAPATHDAEAGSEGGSLSTAGKGEPADFKVAAVA